MHGCDDCLAVCPWNKFATKARNDAFHPRDELNGPLLVELATLDDSEFRKLFARSPVKRTGRNRFVRNVLVAIGNSGAPNLIPAIKSRLSDESSLVRGAAIWALAQLDAGEAQKARERLQRNESDPTVLAEWRCLDDPDEEPH